MSTLTDLLERVGAADVAAREHADLALELASKTRQCSVTHALLAIALELRASRLEYVVSEKLR